jgi:DpnII restriction endonuclease
VVFVNTTTLLLDDAGSRLRSTVEKLHTAEPLHAAFASWLCQGTDAAFSVEQQANEAASLSAGDRTFKEVSILGFAVNTGVASSETFSALQTGLDWVTGRASTIVGEPAGFCSNGIALLGIAVGVKTVGDSSLTAKATAWLSAFVAQGMRGKMVPDWQQFLFVAAANVLGVTEPLAVTEDASTADVRVALRGLGVLPAISSTEREVEERDALLLIRTPCAQEDGLRAPVRLAALTRILQELPTLNLSRPTISEVIQLLNRVEAALRRWTWEERPRTRGATPRQWNIDNEYHVQNLLWMILSPIFPDLQDEVYTEAFGQLHPRIDLCIPSLKLIIEVKFVRQDARFAKVVEEISADCGVYLSRPAEYQHIVPFIWDDSSRVQEHDFLRTGLRKLNGVIDAVIVSRPSSFLAPSAS